MVQNKCLPVIQSNRLKRARCDQDVQMVQERQMSQWVSQVDVTVFAVFTQHVPYSVRSRLTTRVCFAECGHEQGPRRM